MRLVDEHNLTNEEDQMRKKDELTKEHTCMQNAHDEEMTFVLLSRDAAAPVAIRAWVAERIRLGKNAETDAQIVEALECARTMEAEGRLWTGAFPGMTQDEAKIAIAEWNDSVEARRRYEEWIAGGRRTPVW